jgi:hypothetical protein
VSVINVKGEGHEGFLVRHAIMRDIPNEKLHALHLHVEDSDAA